MSNDPAKRKTTNASHIEVTFWFRNSLAFAAFTDTRFAPKAITITEREWDAAPIQYDEFGYVRKFRFVHTCRNTGAHKSDTQRFVRTTMRASQVRPEDLDVMDIQLLSRDPNVLQTSLKLPPERLGIGYLTDPRFNE
jgi:hypothetical protein